jgi:hypothetical protein
MRVRGTWVLVVAALAACQSAAPGTVTVTPASLTLAPGASAPFTATAPGGGAAGVAWSVGCGSIDGHGLTVTYTAPPTEGTCTLRAVAVANPSASAEAVVTVEATPTGDLVWRRQSGTALAERATAVAVAADGGPVVVGTTGGAFGGPSAGGDDLFVARYDAQGNLQARRQHGSGAQDRAAAVALLPSGDIVVVGSIFGGTSAGGEDAFVMVVDPQAAIVWTWQFGTAAADAATGVAVDANGAITVVGRTAGDLAGPGAGLDDLFVARFAATGGPPTALLQFGTAAHDRARAVAVDAAGDVVVVGETRGALRGASAGSSDAFALRLRPDGSEVWGVQFGTSVFDTATGVAIGPAGEVAVVGWTFGGLYGPHAGLTDAFVVRLDADGAPLWSAQLGGPGDDAATGAAFDGRGQLVVAGQTDGPLAGTLKGGFDAFAVRFDAAGGELWRQQFGTSEFEFTTGVAVDAERHAFVVGSTQGAFDGPSAGGQDVYVVKLAP